MNEKLFQKNYCLLAPGQGSNSQPLSGFRLTKLPSWHWLTSAAHTTASSGIGGGGGPAGTGFVCPSGWPDAVPAGGGMPHAARVSSIAVTATGRITTIPGPAALSA